MTARVTNEMRFSDTQPNTATQLHASGLKRWLGHSHAERQNTPSNEWGVTLYCKAEQASKLPRISLLDPMLSLQDLT